MEIKTTTTYTNSLVKEFLQVYYFERTKNFRIIFNILVIILLIRFFFLKDIQTLDIITIIFALLGVIEINTSILPIVNYKRLEKNKNSIINTKIKYIFKEYNFMLNSGKEEYINYKDLCKVIENSTAYYLYINKYRSLIVDKQKLNKEEINLLTNNLKNKVPTYKYIK